MTQSELRELLEEYRDLNPINYRDLADLIGISTTTLCAFMNGKHIRVDTWRKISLFIEQYKCLDVETDIES